MMTELRGASNAKAKYDETVEVAMRLGVDPRKADQMVRGTVNLPHGTGKTARVIVFATGDKAAEAEAAGADVVGGDDLIERIQGGFLDFDAAVATPDQMGKVGRIARILGPRGLMPNPKTGTVTPDVGKAVSDIKGGKVNFRVDKQANLHLVIGKASFDETKLVENYAAALDEVSRAKPSSSKGKYLKKVVVTTTMGPGIPVDPNRTRNLLADAEVAQDLGRGAVVARIRGQPEVEVGVHGVASAVLEGIGLQLRDQADPPALVAAQVDHDTASLGDDPLEGLVELRAAVAAMAAEHVPGQALRVHPGQDRLVARHVAVHQRDVLGVVDGDPVAEGGEVAEPGGQAGLGDALDVPENSLV